MEYNTYYIHYPDGDKQEIKHQLKIGDLVDINGFIFKTEQLDPSRIAYQVTGLKKIQRFKEVDWHFKLDLMYADEVKDEKQFRKLMEMKEKKINDAFNRIVKNFSKTEKGKKWHSR